MVGIESKAKNSNARCFILNNQNNCLYMKGKSLYPDILFHFTQSIGNLIQIFQQGFHLSYARETFRGPKETVDLATPMVSFCDLKLSELKSHMGNYGDYGIGLTKEWACKNGLNPVFYLSKNSWVVDDYVATVKAVYNNFSATYTEQYDGQLNELEEAVNNSLSMYRFMKNYEGRLIRQNGDLYENYRFADEREWRYVPKDIDIWLKYVPLDELKVEKWKERWNNKIQKMVLKFHPDDIRYIIVKDDEEIVLMVEKLTCMKESDGYTRDVVQRLCSRVLTKRQIDNDM